MELHEKIRWLRLKLNLSQKAFAQSIGTSRSVLSQIEIGKLKPSIELVIRVADKYQVSYDFLLGSEAIKTKSPEDEELKSKTDFTPQPQCLECQQLIKINQAQESIIQSLKKTISAQEKLISLLESKLSGKPNH